LATKLLQYLYGQVRECRLGLHKAEHSGPGLVHTGRGKGAPISLCYQQLLTCGLQAQQYCLSICASSNMRGIDGTPLIAQCTARGITGPQKTVATPTANLTLTACLSSEALAQSHAGSVVSSPFITPCDCISQIWGQANTHVAANAPAPPWPCVAAPVLLRAGALMPCQSYAT
jgi:hypothetical protein